MDKSSSPISLQATAEHGCPGSVGPAGRAAARRLVGLRWLAILAVVGSSVAARIMGVVDDPVALYYIAGGLAVANAVFEVSLRSGYAGPYAVCIQMMVDLMALTGLLHFAGGVGNPLVALYIVHAILAAILLPRAHSYMVAATACMLFQAMVFGEMFGLIAHHPLHVAVGAPDLTARLAADPRFVFSMTGVCVLLVSVAVFFVSPVMEDLRRREAALSRTRGRLQAVIDSIGDSIVLFDEDGDALAWNRSGGLSMASPSRDVDPRAAGADGSEGTDRQHARHRPPWPYPGRSPVEVWSDHQLGGEPVFAKETESDGRFLRHRLFPAEEARTGMVWVAEDITERRKLEAKARYQDRMAAVGLLAAGVAHEIRNPLASISAIVEDLESTTEDGTTREDLSTVASHVFRISKVLSQLGGFATPPRDERTDVDINAAIRDASAIVRFNPRCHELTLNEVLADDLPPVNANGDQLIQVFVNLALNAIEAMSPGGKLDIRSYSRGGEVYVEFRDTGPGIRKDLVERIFEPFFTTKEEQNGSGLGLSVCDNIVQAHGGGITVDTASSAGARLVVHLPSSPATN